MLPSLEKLAACSASPTPKSSSSNCRETARLIPVVAWWPSRRLHPNSSSSSSSSSSTTAAALSEPSPLLLLAETS
ncbi:hypothetical protein GUJ93_ZPchr0007g6032 [Zizania palustris]|uniref:Uncharacterized protein n=1 Tax=Zizania palustris TaxID=103762 RepID=A0A8J5T323_ZIZPA|nr:hypothetical protein GUJ93_ZPchr0007g6032 [Zizania palustris]